MGRSDPIRECFIRSPVDDLSAHLGNHSNDEFDLPTLRSVRSELYPSERVHRGNLLSDCFT